MSSARRVTVMDRRIRGQGSPRVKCTRGLRFPHARREVVSGGLDHRSQATRADVPPLCHAVDDQYSGLNIRFEHAVRPPLGEAYVVAKLRRLTTPLTFAGPVENPSALMSLNYAPLPAGAETPMR